MNNIISFKNLKNLLFFIAFLIIGGLILNGEVQIPNMEKFLHYYYYSFSVIEFSWFKKPYFMMEPEVWSDFSGFVLKEASEGEFVSSRYSPLYQ
jgi:hypothetical protein